ncbi:aldose 1-epimerase family protein [Oligosphaera ethanolica]|uniref:DUF4432 domain-containing protein n=1 Tax=Oligosphaera ethanolica TaxID=760260 RepID=A0AAE3VGZ4_9BACT|nr:aldose 1-epimerase family protein [Oligosphaera ethanolica]MDQ0290255.1 hypothetical protein [Oligosphaera ethanolica]
MSKKLSWVLTDTAKRVYVENCTLGATALGMDKDGAWTITKSRLRGGLSDGVDIIEVNNGQLSFTIVPTRGMGLWRGSCGGHAIGWNSPARDLVNPGFINTLEQGGLGWLKGFNECIVRCGLNSNGAPGMDTVLDNNGNPSEVMLTLHGNIANIPAKYVEVEVIPGTPTELVITGVVEESRCFCPQYRMVCRYSTFVGSNKVSIRDEVSNFADCPTEFQMLYHCNFGEPFLEEGAKIVLPAAEVAPRDPRAQEDIDTWDSYRGYEPGYVEQGYYLDVAADAQGRTLSMLKNRASTLGVVIRWDKSQLPSFCQWKHTTGASEGYVTGMEPSINMPNLKSFERQKGRVLTLQPGQTYAIDLAMEIAGDAKAVAAVEAEVAAIMAGRKTTVQQQPVAKWSPCAN